MDSIKQSPELADAERQSTYDAFGRLADQTAAALKLAADKFIAIEAAAQDLDGKQLHPEMATLLPELRIAAIKAVGQIQSLATICAVAKLVSNVGKEEESK